MEETPCAIVVPVDFSDASWAALERAVKLAGGEAGVHVVHVLRPLSAVEPGIVWGTVNDGTRNQAAKDRLHGELQRRGHGRVAARVLFGEPSKAVADYANDKGAPLVIVSAFGHSGFLRSLLGSTAERIVRHCQCDVLVIRPPQGTSASL